MNLTSPITGAAVTGLTSPTYTVSADVPPNASSKQWAVTAIGGTQTGVDTGTSAARPWTLTFTRPSNIRQLNAVDSNNQLRNIAMNRYVARQRKGMTPLAGQASKASIFETMFSIPAGADVADAPNVRAAFSCYVGALWQQADGLTTLALTGVL
jgi:uncharacterized protein YbdZ (MbtH family)